jgi:hypothetical protein
MLIDFQQIKSGMLPKTPKLQSIIRHGNGIARIGPAIRARGITPAQAINQGRA